MTDPDPDHGATARPGAWRPLARAMADYVAGAREATVEIESDDAVVQRVPVALFVEDAEIPEAEAHALDVCRGRVLDVGAGSGRHALVLQEAGAQVTAIDVSPEIVALMRARGVADARVADIFALDDEERFDTILMLMNGIGVVGTLAGLDRFLRHARRLLVPGGQILLDSFDLAASPDPRTLRAIAAREARGRHRGEVTFRLRYGGEEGEPYPWLFVDTETLAAHAAAAGWHVQILYEDADTAFVARLMDAREAAR